MMDITSVAAIAPKCQSRSRSSAFSGGNAASASTAAPAGATTDAGIAPVLPGDAPVWDVASSNSDLSDFAVAADKADLKNQLRDTGNYTVFAPTHAAFAALPAGTLATLEQPANQTALKQLLSLHIVPANRYTIAQLKTLPGATADPGASLTTLTGSPIYVKYTPGASTTDIGSLAVSGQPFGPNNETGIAVTQTDIPARNGVIHPIGAVLPLPTATTATP
jgi:uncharacterized surface protein with fasciclin (FAS1) repeats